MNNLSIFPEGYFYILSRKHGFALDVYDGQIKVICFLEGGGGGERKEVLFLPRKEELTRSFYHHSCYYKGRCKFNCMASKVSR